MKELLLKYSEYNIWANENIVQMIREAENHLFTKDIPSSFPNIRKTVLHIWDAELIWLKRLQGMSPNTWPSASIADDYLDFDQYFINNSRDFNEFIKSKREAFFEYDIHFQDMKGNHYKKRAWQMIMHCMNHSTFHRGQLITMLRTAGHTKLWSTDMITWLRLEEKSDSELDKIYG